MNTNTLVDELLATAKKYYEVNAEICEYHNYAHAMQVLAAVNILADHNPSMALTLAATWHDAVYHPGAAHDSNEQCSSAALANVAIRLNKTAPLPQSVKDAVNKAQDLIEYTSVKYHLHKVRIKDELAILLDADLSSLATTNYDAFVAQQGRIIRENDGSVPGGHKASAEFLVKFLACRECIYHTDKARNMWEQQARDNIQRWCRENEVTYDY